MEIRLAREEDLPVLAEMYLRLFRHVHRTEGGTVEEKLSYAAEKMRAEGHFILLAEIDGEVVGTLAVRLIDKDIGFIYDAWVAPKHRRRGVMTELEGWAVEFLRERGVTTAELNVRAGNEEGMGTWPNLGYEPTSSS